MNTLVLYDSQYGNTQKLAETIVSVLAKKGKSKLLFVEKAKLTDFEYIDLLVCGSPTQGGQPKKSMTEFLQTLPKNLLKGVKVASFDTRFLTDKQSLFLKLLMKTIGYAAPKMQNILIQNGGKEVAGPEGFIVEGTKGPLSKGELQRAKNWANNLN